MVMISILQQRVVHQVNNEKSSQHRFRPRNVCQSRSPHPSQSSNLSKLSTLTSSWARIAWSDITSDDPSANKILWNGNFETHHDMLFHISFWHSVKHIFWQSFWHIFWHSIWHVLLANFLALFLAFFLAVEARRCGEDDQKDAETSSSKI